MPWARGTPRCPLRKQRPHNARTSQSAARAPRRAGRPLLASHQWQALLSHIRPSWAVQQLTEPYWAHQATHALHTEGITTDITPSLREAINQDWEWANYPLHGLTREEIREVSSHAQQIHDDIRHGRLIIHAHAHDGHTTIAIGTYRGGQTVALHGENHLRTITDTYQSPAHAVASFHRLHGNAVRPGPSPMTDTEQAAAHARTTFTPPDTAPTPEAPRVETVPAYAAHPGDHEATLDDFLTENPAGRNTPPGTTAQRSPTTNHSPCASSSTTPPKHATRSGPSPPTRHPSANACGA
ncbi:hypothetical protein ACWD4G_31925 [Streptomyces sp. NPDC002643]